MFNKRTEGCRGKQVLVCHTKRMGERLIVFIFYIIYMIVEGQCSQVMFYFPVNCNVLQ